MKEIKFTTGYESALLFSDKDFKMKYEERVGNNPGYTQMVNGETKHLAVCPRCNNPVVVLGIYKKIDVAPHARHAKGINIPNAAQYNEYKYLHCPYHRRKADYVKEYVPETEQPQRQTLYKLAKEHFDKAIYLLQKETGIYITLKMAEALAENYARMRAYNYIDATIYNIPWYLLYSFPGFPLYHMNARKNSSLYKHLVKIGLNLKESKIENYAYVEDRSGHLLRATNYRYRVDDNDNINEWLDFSILRPDDSVSETLLYVPVERFSIKVDSYYFGNLIRFPNWNTRQSLIEIAEEYMCP